MGMFDKDKEIGRSLTGEFKEREQFIIYGLKVDSEKVDTNTGLPPATKTRLKVATLDSPLTPFEVTTLGAAIAVKAAEATAEDFPAVVYWLKVDSNYGNQATVLRFVSAYTGPTPGNQGTPSGAGTGQDDPPPF